jgi:mannose-6-phosphate isomerase-like protein (cupin superfamily)
MLKVGDVLDLGPLGIKFHIKKTSAETSGQSFDMELELNPHRDAGLIHIHPHAVESYKVLQGKFDVYINGDWKTLSVGEKAVVDQGVPHTFRNTGDETTRVYNTHQPAMRFDQFFEALGKLAQQSGVSSSQQRRPRTFKDILLVSIVYTSYPDEIRAVRPPHALMQVFGFVGRLLGYKV